MALWQEFEHAETPEARFAHARTVPCLYCSIWPTRDKAGVKTASAMSAWYVRVAPPIKAGCPALWDYLEARLEDVRRKGWFGAD